MFKRTGEMALGIVGAVLNGIGIIILSLVLIGWNAILTSEDFDQAFYDELAQDPTMTAEDIQLIQDSIGPIFSILGTVGWALVIFMIVSLILSIVAVVQIKGNKNPKLAGILFIIAGLLAGLISLPSILLYIAAIMCFVRKAPVEDTFYSSNSY